MDLEIPSFLWAPLIQPVLANSSELLWVDVIKISYLQYSSPINEFSSYWLKMQEHVFGNFSPGYVPKWYQLLNQNNPGVWHSVTSFSEPIRDQLHKAVNFFWYIVQQFVIHNWWSVLLLIFLKQHIMFLFGTPNRTGRNLFSLLCKGLQRQPTV